MNLLSQLLATQRINDEESVEDSTFPVDVTSYDPNNLQLCLKTYISRPVDLDNIVIMVNNGGVTAEISMNYIVKLENIGGEMPSLPAKPGVVSVSVHS